MRTSLSNWLRVVVPVITVVVVFGVSNSYGQSSTGREYIPSYTRVNERVDHPEGNGANPMAYSRAEDARVTRALDQADAARQASPPRYDDAEHAYRFAIFADPYDTRAYFGLGFIFAAQKRYGEAVRAYQKAVEAQPNSAAAHFNLGLMYARLNNNAEVVKQVKILERLKSPLAARLAAHVGQ